MHFKKCFFLVTCLLVFAFVKSTAQTCTGSLGDPIVNINFGAGVNFGPPLPAGTTSSLQYQAATCPADGYYSILNYTSGCWPNDVVWHTATDHTGNSNGYYMLVNASNQPSNFYIQTIDGLCEGTTYQFAAWLLNMCSVRGILPNITFTIEKTDGTILGTYNTNDIPIKNPVSWNQYGFYFTTPPGVSTVVLRMRNNAQGGVGNDLGLDDITFRPAGPAITIGITGFTGDTLNLCVYNTDNLRFVSTVENCYTSTAYQWQLSVDNGLSWNNISGAGSASYTRLPTITGNYLYRLTVAQAANIGISNCRVVSNPILVNVNPQPVTTTTSNSPKCGGGTILLNAGTGTSYNWSGPNGFSASGPQVSISNATVANAGKYYVTVTSSFNCVNVDSTIVNVFHSPVAIFASATPACEKNILSFTDQSITSGHPLLKWAWNFGDGASAFSSSPSHVFAQAGDYPVSLYVENDKGCKSAIIIKSVVVHPLPKPGFGLPGICLADPFATFSDSSAIADNSESQFLYLWNFGDVNSTPPNPNSSTRKNPRHTYSSIGIYPVRLTVTSKDGCVKDTMKSFTVNGAQPIAKFTIDSGVNFCSNSIITITNGASVNFGNITRVEIYWDFQNDPSLVITDSFPSPGKKYTYRYPAFGSPVTKIAAVRYVVYSGISCVNETMQRVTIKASPALLFAPLNNVCEEAIPFSLTQATEINGLAGTGTYSGAGINAGGLFDPRAAIPGNHIIRYTFSASNNCTAFAEQSIKVFEQPFANAGPDRTILRGGHITLNATANGNGLKYEWAPNTDIDDNKILVPKVSPLRNITYALNVVSADGCEAKDEVLITVLKDIYVPTAFSPNADGTNDVWHIPFLNSYSGARVEVFNRYGQIVYQSGNNSIGWDGQFKGKPLPSGSYVWMLNAGNRRKSIYGMVTIVR